MRRFTIRLTLFLLPLLVYPGLPACVVLTSGELAAPERVAERQRQPRPLLFGRAYRDGFYGFKLLAVAQRRPEVLVLGSSRVMEFRATLCTRQAEAFYNAGGAVRGVDEALTFLQSLPHEALPDVLLLGLDQVWFNARRSWRTTAQQLHAQADEERRVIKLERVLYVTNRLWDDWWRRKISLRQILAGREPVQGGRALGLQALMHGNGFRNDGSYQRGEELLHPLTVAQKLEPGLRHLQEDENQAMSADHADPGSLADLEALLAFCQQRKIVLIGFSMPFAPTIYRAMRTGGRHGYLDEQAAYVAEAFRRHGLTYVDCTDAGALGATDDDMEDYSHPTERLVVRMYLRLLDARSDVLDKYSDRRQLQRLAAQPRVLARTPQPVVPRDVSP